ncbi:MAG: hypothetical protein LBC28_03135 [Oscillospiraceae bacterium]|nr:hypothetical protein [Oscillospiraceae bacterium]
MVEALPIYGSPSSNADYELQEWANAGLRKPSGVSLLPVKINEDSFDRRAGRLNVADIRKIIKQMSE